MVLTAHLSRSLVSQNKKELFNELSFDIGSATENKNPDKDIGEYHIRMQTEFPLPHESCGQEVLQQIRKVICDKPVSESKLQFAPRWVIDKAIEKEKKIYKASVQNLPTDFSRPGGFGRRL